MDDSPKETPPVTTFEPIDEMPAEANEADVIEQHEVVPMDDDDPAG